MFYPLFIYDSEAVFSKALGNDEDFLSAWIVTLLKMMAFIAKKAFKKLWTMYSEYKFWFSVLMGWYSSSLSNWIFHDIGNFLSHFKNDKFYFSRRSIAWP